MSGHSSKLSHRPRGDETRLAAQEDPSIRLTSDAGWGPSSVHPLVETNDAAKALLDAGSEYPSVEMNNTAKALLNALKYDREDYTAA